MTNSDFIYGKDKTQHVVSVEVQDHYTKLFIETRSGIETKTIPSYYWILYNKYADDRIRLDGDLHYKYAKKFSTEEEYKDACNMARQFRQDYYTVWNRKEQFLVKNGITSFKGMHPKDLSVVSFDIETTGLDPKNSEVLLISTTYRKGGFTEKKMFAYDDYNSEKEMIYAWCNYIRTVNPSILLGHNIFGFDLPFLNERTNGTLNLGRDGSSAKFAKRTSQFRRDGSQSYDYNNVLVYGREIVDTFFLAIKYDFKRNYPSYGLKAIIESEGLQRTDRVLYDASTIRENYKDPIEWEKIKIYCKDDSDDALALFDLMIPSYFYYAQSIPKSFQQIINTATGSQVNSFLVRSYLAVKHSLPKADEPIRYKGGISYGNPGQYKAVGKVDVASLYPSIIRQYRVCNSEKDPKHYFLKMVETFTKERLANKTKAKETGERYYSDLSEAQKILINSAYGFLNAPGLNFNSPEHADMVTAHGRRILTSGVEWAEEKGFKIVNVDTDSFSFTTGNRFPRGAFREWIKELNSIFESGIIWEDDGIFRDVIVVKAKNYVLRAAGSDEVIIKGSALKASMKEPALKQFIKDVIYARLENENADISNIYLQYVRRINNIGNMEIDSWCSKKTVTKAILNSPRTNEIRIRQAIERAKKVVQEGDKIYTYFKDDETVELVDMFDGEYDKNRLYEKLFKTIKIFETILDISQFPNYKLKKNKALLDEKNNRPQLELLQA